MPKYLVQATFAAEGARGTLREGGTLRREAVAKLAESVGGRLESMYFAFGDEDVYCILEMPDNVSMAAASMTVAAAGHHHVRTAVLLTPEEIDQVRASTPEYRSLEVGDTLTEHGPGPFRH